MTDRTTGWGLTPEVQALIDSGKLHQFDGEWICRLRPESQMAAARKCIHGTCDILTPVPDRFTKTAINHGSVRM